MYQYRYRLTLYNTTRFDEFLTYEFPHLPAQSDMIEVSEGCLFEVKSRCFQPRQEGKIIHVTLHGVIVNGDEKGQYSWEKLKEKILDQREGIKRNREGMVEYREPFAEFQTV